VGGRSGNIRPGNHFVASPFALFLFWLVPFVNFRSDAAVARENNHVQMLDQLCKNGAGFSYSLGVLLCISSGRISDSLWGFGRFPWVKLCKPPAFLILFKRLFKQEHGISRKAPG